MTTTTTADRTHAALLRAVLEQPGDDLPRLAFADWLEEHGEDARAEFIRVQLQLAAGSHDSGACKVTGICPGCVRQARLEWRESELAGLRDRQGTPCRYLWFDGFTSAVLVGWRYEFRRGFVASITLPHADFLRHAPALFASQPITGVRLNDRLLANDWGGREGWFRYEDATGTDELPPALFDLLTGFDRDIGVAGLRYRDWGDPRSAAAALSRAAVAHGRAAAGLPPLKE